ncbi:FHA domain-containing protein [Streptomyces antnestii]|uniref:FHA domain-containing protein n=1 Tax=Streptomyces antnestii TaxID=2494256 RepID=A0A3S2Z0J4_9ACTN|nr:FHA domain-containing protein [Streptomyces sp. San01]RVU24515.1 FHA domain-containing protein [Streptomyces sp. San01]
MQIRLTVVDPLGTRPDPQGRAASRDVLVTAPAGTALAAVAPGLVAAVAGGEGTAILYAGPERLDGQRCTLGEPPLIDGTVLSLGVPAEPGPELESAEAQLHVVAGPDAGGVHLLHGGEIRVGRSADADIALDDPDVSRMHCAVTLDTDGRVTVTDLGSTNGTTVDGGPVGDRPARLAPGALLRLGESTLRLAPAGATGSPGTALRTAPDGEGHVRVTAPDVDASEGHAARPPLAGETRHAYGPGAMAAGPGPVVPLQGGAPAVESSPGTTPVTPARGTPVPREQRRRGGLGAWARRLAGGRAGDDDVSPYDSPYDTDGADRADGYHGEPDPHGREAFAAAPAGSRDAWPDPAALLLTALGPGFRLWERGPGHSEALAVRLGTDDRTSPDRTGLLPGVPVTVGLREAGALGLAGPRARLSGVARSVVAQLAALHSPDVLEIVLVSTDRSRTVQDRAADWSWLGWLPHLRPTHGQDCRLLLAYDREQALARTGELLRRLDDHIADEARRPGGPGTAAGRAAGQPGAGAGAGLGAQRSGPTVPRSRSGEAADAGERGGGMPAAGPYGHEGASRGGLGGGVEGATGGRGPDGHGDPRFAAGGPGLDGHRDPRVAGGPGTDSHRDPRVAGGPGPEGYSAPRFAADGTGPDSHRDPRMAGGPGPDSHRDPRFAADRDEYDEYAADRNGRAAEHSAGHPASATGRSASTPGTGHSASAPWTDGSAPAPRDAWAPGVSGTPETPHRWSGPLTVLVVDGDPGAAGLREATVRLATEGGRAGIHVICLAEAPASSPASPVTQTYEMACAVSPAFKACGAVALLSGDVATALRLMRTSHGQVVGHGTVAAIDAVSAAWAERFARALAPLRTDTGPAEPHPRVSAPLPQTARLLDELGLARATPASLMARWAAAGDDTEALGGRAWAVLGAGPRGPVVVDLAAEGPHLVIEGPAGSGRTELLRSTAASLAAAERPDRLGLVLIDGRDGTGGSDRGDGLRVCTDLPHVTTHLTANDPVRMREFAQSLAAELKRRAELLGRQHFAEWHTQREVSGRLVAQRPAPVRPSDQGAGDLDTPPSSTMRLRPGAARKETDAAPPLPRLVVLVDDLDALLSPPLGSPGRPAAGSVVRALEAVVREGERLGVHLVAARASGSEPAWGVALRVVLDAPSAGPEEPAPGRGRLSGADGRELAFQTGRVTGRIPRTATQRPTVVPLDWTRMGDPPTRRPVRELGNGPTDLALLASALERAARSVSAREVPSLL